MFTMKARSFPSGHSKVSTVTLRVTLRGVYTPEIVTQEGLTFVNIHLRVVISRVNMGSNDEKMAGFARRDVTKDGHQEPDEVKLCISVSTLGILCQPLHCQVFVLKDI